jgi:hypothetical protein
MAAGFKNTRALADAELAGQYLHRSWMKIPAQVTISGIWFDLSMSPGNPGPNYYIGPQNVFQPMRRSTHGGLDHGGNVEQLGYRKHLRKLIGYWPLFYPLTMIMLDYAGFYPFIDESVTDEQFMDNTLAPARWAGSLQLMPVVVAGQIGGQPFTVKYTNQDGVSGRVTPSVTMTIPVANGSILSSLPAGANYCGPFLSLQQGDTGVRSVESVTIGGSGDTGLFALVLVKPVATLDLLGGSAPTEIDYFTDCGCSLPVIGDDAYLNFICLPTASLLSRQIFGMIETTWG